MQKYSLILGLFFAFTYTFGQKPRVKNEPNHNDRPVHFGFSVGFNAMDFRVKHSQYAFDNGIIADNSELQPGFNVQIISNFRLSKYFDFRFMPGISFGGRRILTYKEKNINTGFDQVPLEHEEQLESNFIEMPLLIKYRAARINNFGPYLVSGINFRYDLGPAARQEYINEEGEEHFVILNRFDYYWEIGVGLDFYMVYFKLSTEIKYCIGLRNILAFTDKDGDAPDKLIAPYTNSIDQLYSNLFMISFHFE